MYDNELLFFNKIVTGNEAGAYNAIPKGSQPMELNVMVPSLAETGDKIAVTLTWSDDGTNAQEVLTMPDITYANVVTNKITEYRVPVTMHRSYLKVALTCTDADSGSDFTTTTKLLCGLVPAGRHDKR